MQRGHTLATKGCARVLSSTGTGRDQLRVVFLSAPTLPLMRVVDVMKATSADAWQRCQHSACAVLLSPATKSGAVALHEFIPMSQAQIDSGHVAHNPYCMPIEVRLVLRDGLRAGGWAQQREHALEEGRSAGGAQPREGVGALR